MYDTYSEGTYENFPEAQHEDVVISMCRSLAATWNLRALSTLSSYEWPREKFREGPAETTTGKLLCYKSAHLEGTSVTFLENNYKNSALFASAHANVNDMFAPGWVCCWNTKNHEFPERQWRVPIAPTALSFSTIQVNMLSVGLSNGAILMLNVSNSKIVAGSTTRLVSKHRAPVKFLSWLDNDKPELQVISLSEDGTTNLWTLRSTGVECELVMTLKCVKMLPLASCQPPAARFSSQYTFPSMGITFERDPSDDTQYWLGTGDGCIYHCSLLHMDKPLKMMANHIGPVTALAWSIKDGYTLISGGWDGKLLAHTFYNGCHKVQSIGNIEGQIIDLEWSPHNPMEFICLKANKLQLWNISTDILKPRIEVSLSEKYNCMTFHGLTKGLLLGDTNGNIQVMMCNVV
ncbi:dynein axonemal intermediate chain 4-like [Artemia franciscana]|uniref:dynein axonemal intermediate chain 4-like n=1 Tax=Artemia franciscana TaxID=6661 RepID=UPI0032DA62F3